MRYALILTTLALTVLAAPLPVEQARDDAIDEQRYVRKYGDDMKLNSREVEVEADEEIEANERRSNIRMANSRREAEADGNLRPNRREAEADGNLRPNRREAEADGNLRLNKAREAEADGNLRPNRARDGNLRPNKAREAEADGNLRPNKPRDTEGLATISRSSIPA